MIMILRKYNMKLEAARSGVILYGFGDPNISLDDDIGSKLKADHAVTAHLTSKISLKELNQNLRSKGWLMHKTSFSPEFDGDEKRYWSLTKIADSKAKNVTMRSALNTDPEGNLTSPFTSGGTFTAPPEVPKGCVPCSTIHTSLPQVRIDNEWGWAFDTPPPKE